MMDELVTSGFATPVQVSYPAVVEVDGKRSLVVRFGFFGSLAEAKKFQRVFDEVADTHWRESLEHTFGSNCNLGFLPKIEQDGDMQVAGFRNKFDAALTAAETAIDVVISGHIPVGFEFQEYCEIVEQMDGDHEGAKTKAQQIHVKRIQERESA